MTVLQKRKPTHVLGFLGTTLDQGASEKRWNKWRPTVSICAHDDFPVDSLDLWYSGKNEELLATVCADIAQVSPSTKSSARKLAIKDPWDFQQVYTALLDFAKSFHFRDDVDYYVHLTTGSHVMQICVFLLVESRYLPAKLLQSSSKDSEGVPNWKGSLSVIDLNLSNYQQLASRFAEESLDHQGFLKAGIPTQNKAFNAMIARIEKVSLASAAPLLLTGPTGAGKTKLAKRIFELKKSRHLIEGSFVEVNCATLRGDNAMSTLFGHKKGAFTGALADRSGLIKAADKGLLFLDEIAELGEDEQALLLRALEDKKFRPLGSDIEIGSDFQLIAGTHQNLSQLVQKGEFRADLLARINLWTFELPALKDRPEDIAPNVDVELSRISEQLGLRITWTADAKEAFLAYALGASWPGNFRDLSACLTRICTLASQGRITLDDVKLEIEGKREAAPQTTSLLAKVFPATTLETIDAFDKAAIEVVLSTIHKSSSMAEAGRLLFSASRMQKASSNDTDRVKKFLTKWGLTYSEVKVALMNND